MQHILYILLFLVLTIQAARSQSVSDSVIITIEGDYCNIGETNLPVRISNLGNDDIEIVRYEICKMKRWFREDYSIDSTLGEPFLKRDFRKTIKPKGSFKKEIDLEIFKVREYNGEYYFKIFYKTQGNETKSAGHFFVTPPMYIVKAQSDDNSEWEEGVFREDLGHECFSNEELSRIRRHADSAAADFWLLHHRKHLYRNGGEPEHPDSAYSRVSRNYSGTQTGKDLFFEKYGEAYADTANNQAINILRELITIIQKLSCNDNQTFIHEYKRIPAYVAYYRSIFNSENEENFCAFCLLEYEKRINELFK